MSDPVVINAFKAILATTGAPFVDTLNVRPATLPNTFSTLERDHAEVARITIGTPAQFRESGVLQIVVHVRAGLGDGPAQMLAEQIRDAFHDYAAGNLFVLAVGSATVFEPDDGNFFEMKVPVHYQYDFFKP